MAVDDQEYSRISTAEEDITRRLRQEEREGWLSRRSGSPLVAEWTDGLREFSPGEKLSCSDAIRCLQLVRLYDSYKTELDTLASELDVGYVGDLTPGETVFVTLIRDMQRRAGELINFNEKTFAALRDGNYSVARALQPDELEQVESSKVTPLKSAPEPTLSQDIKESLEKKKQVVLYGPPGTGKTYTARRFARWWISNQDPENARENQIRSVTFHPSYSYEDFIEGLTANASSDGRVKYSVKAGAFRRIAQDAYEDYVESVDVEEIDPPHYVLIIDEINRGDLSQIFGEVITSLESDKRLDQEDEMVVELPYSGEPLVVPPNLYLIATMNTADRSIALVDAAIRRRFDFIALLPDYSLIQKEYGFNDEQEVRGTIKNSLDPFRVGIALSYFALKSINEIILKTPDLGKGKQLGHSYLLGLKAPSDILHTWRKEILPLLEEYYFGQFDNLRSDIFLGKGGKLINWSHQNIRKFDLDELYSELSSLVGINTNRGMKSVLEEGELHTLLNQNLLDEGSELMLLPTVFETMEGSGIQDEIVTTVALEDGEAYVKFEDSLFAPAELARQVMKKGRAEPLSHDMSEIWIEKKSKMSIAEIWNQNLQSINPE